ncbi:MAG TPA: hypothetical protein VJB10_04360 [Candidatus Peribacteraceae bacterium]|nr:hypothetical protein [Candidatus Peribacteraceae bacterium]
MFPHKHFTGLSPSEREKRLCGNLDRGGNFEQLGHQLGQGIGNFVDRMATKFREAIGTNEASRTNMLTEKAWVDAFNRDEIFRDEQVTPLNDKQVFGPRDVLMSMPLQERKVEFVRFMRELVPDDIRDAFTRLDTEGRATGGVFKDPAFRTFDPNVKLDHHMKTRRDVPISLPEDDLETMRMIMRMLMGEDVRNGNPLTDRDLADIQGGNYDRLRDNAEDPFLMASYISAAALDRYYLEDSPQPSPDDTDIDVLRRRRMYNDYRNLLNSLKPPVTAAQAEDADLLMQRLPPSRLKAAIRFGIIDDHTLKGELAKLYRFEERDRASVRHEAEQERNEYNRRSIQESIRGRNRTMMDNFYNMSGKEKFFGIAIASFAAYKMVSSSSRILKTIPFALAGVYFYQRMVLGDKQPLNKWGKFTQDVVKLTGKPIRAGLEKMNILAPQSDIDALNIMSNFLEEKDIVTSKPIAQSLAAMAQVKLGTIASNLSIDRNSGSALLEVSDNSLLTLEISEIARRNNWDRALIVRGLQENQGEVSDAMAEVMLLIGAEDYPDIQDRLEKKMNAQGVRTIQEIRDNGESKADYFTLIERGRQKAQTEYADMDFLDIIQRFSREEKPASTVTDNADHIESPLSAGNRENERKLYGEVRTHALGLQTRNELLRENGLANREIREALHTLRNFASSPKEIIDAGAETFLLQRFDALCEKGDTPLGEILIAIEQLKYGILIDALSAKKIPLNRDNVNDIVGGPSGVLESITSFVNRSIVGASSHFGAIENLGNLDSILAERIASGVRSSDEAGLVNLRRRIDTYNNFFTRLRQADVLNPTLVKDLEDELGKEASAFLERIFAMPDRAKRIDLMEKYLAQRMTNAVATAMLTEHRANGVHTLITDPAKRFITPREEQNLLKEFDELFASIVDGKGVSSNLSERKPGSEGMWEMVDLLNTNIESFERDIPALNAESYTQARERIGVMARVWYIHYRNNDAAAEGLEGNATAIARKIRQHLVALRDADPSVTLNPPSLFNRGSNAEGYRMAKLMAQWLKAIGDPASRDLAAELESMLGKKEKDTSTNNDADNADNVDDADDAGNADLDLTPEGKEKDKKIRDYEFAPGVKGLKIDRVRVPGSVVIYLDDDGQEKYHWQLTLEEYNRMSAEEIITEWKRRAFEKLKEQMNDPTTIPVGLMDHYRGYLPWTLELGAGDIVKWQPTNNPAVSGLAGDSFPPGESPLYKFLFVEKILNIYDAYEGWLTSGRPTNDPFTVGS